MIAFPGLYSLPCKRRSLFYCAFGSVSHLWSYYYTDAMGSAWCFVNVFQIIFHLGDYLFFTFPGDEEEMKNLEIEAKKKATKVE